LLLGTETVQDAVQLTLSSLPSQTSGGSTDYSTNFGNVNGLGIGPGAGITATSVSGGYVYSASYSLTPVFTDFSSTKATIKVCVSQNFAHSALLTMERSTTGVTGPFAATSTTCPGDTITSSAADQSPVTDYLGVFVNGGTTSNGVNAYIGSDNAVLKYTLTVP
jgi:hypothetical protein